MINRLQYLHASHLESALQANEIAAGEPHNHRGHHCGHGYDVGKHRRASPPKRPVLRPRRRGPTTAGINEDDEHPGFQLYDDEQYSEAMRQSVDMKFDSEGDERRQDEQTDHSRQGFGPCQDQLEMPANVQKYSMGEPGQAREELGASLLREARPGADVLFGSPPSGLQTDAMLSDAHSALLLSSVRRALEPGGSASLTHMILSATQAVLARQPRNMTSVTELSDVKSALISLVGEVWQGWEPPPDAPESLKGTLALLPLARLNLTRPRTPKQRGRTDAPLSMLANARALP